MMRTIVVYFKICTRISKISVRVPLKWHPHPKIYGFVYLIIGLGLGLPLKFALGLGLGNYTIFGRGCHKELFPRFPQIKRGLHYCYHTVLRETLLGHQMAG